MNKTYEFGYQTRKQKIVLWSCKLVVAILLGFAIYRLGWANQPIADKLAAAGGIFIWFWVYSNLCRVKIEIQELFVPPFDTMHMVESMVVGAVLATTKMFMTIYDIGRLSGWWS